MTLRPRSGRGSRLALHALAGGLADDPEFAAGSVLPHPRPDRVGARAASRSSSTSRPGRHPVRIPALRALVDNPAGCECPQDDPAHQHAVVRLVAIVPLLACLGGSVATNIGARRVLGPLMSMAKRAPVRR